jgi:hypothetical protein
LAETLSEALNPSRALVLCMQEASESDLTQFFSLTPFMRFRAPLRRDCKRALAGWQGAGVLHAEYLKCKGSLMTPFACFTGGAGAGWEGAGALHAGSIQKRDLRDCLSHVATESLLRTGFRGCESHPGGGQPQYWILLPGIPHLNSTQDLKYASRYTFLPNSTFWGEHLPNSPPFSRLSSNASSKQTRRSTIPFKSTIIVTNCWPKCKVEDR